MGMTTHTSESMVRRLAEGAVDVIGDVHGEIGPLRGLLARMGYDEAGRHPAGRRVVFIGDLTDRGPDSVAVGELAMDWVGRGVAECLLGNHELNILRRDLKHGNSWILKPTARELQAGGEFGHCRIADEVFSNRYVAFLATLPVALERDDLRLVHAAWVSGEIDALRCASGPVAEVFERYDVQVDAQLGMEGVKARAAAEWQQWHAALKHWKSKDVPLLTALGESDERHQMGNPVRVATSGVERLADRPFWSSGKWRMVNRVAWWNEYTDDVPVIVGHYWRRWQAIRASEHAATKPDMFGDAPPDAWLGPKRNVFCVDYSIGARYEERKKGEGDFATYLMAMRWPERELWGETGRMLG